MTNEALLVQLAKKYPDVVKAAIITSIENKIEHLERELNEIKKRIYRLEEEHKMKLEHFEKTMGDSFEGHEI